MVEVEDVIVVVEVVRWEAGEMDVGDGGGSRVESEAEQTDVRNVGGSRTAGTGAVCWVLWAMRVRVPARASGVLVRPPWRPVCVQVLVPRIVSYVVRGGVVELSWMRGLVIHQRGVHFSPRTCGRDCLRQRRVLKKHHWMPGMSSSVRFW